MNRPRRPDDLTDAEREHLRRIERDKDIIEAQTGIRPDPPY